MEDETINYLRRLKWVGLVVVLLAVLLITSLTASTKLSRAAPTTTYTLQGRVYEGATGLEPPQSTPIQGVTVTLHCAGNPNDTGSPIVTRTTDSNGWYGLPVDDSAGCEYLNIIETDPPGYTSNGATTMSGTVKSPNWIQYDLTTIPLSQQGLMGNKFWDAPPPLTTTCTSCTDCSDKLKGIYSVVQLANDINTTGTQCVKIDTDDVTFDCQGHAIHATSHAEQSYGVGVTTHSNVTVTGCTISGFQTGIWLYATTGSSLLTNTITDANTGIALGASDGNLLSGNQISQTQVGVSLSWSDNNGFRHNRLCKQTTQDIKGLTHTTSNTRLGNTCDSIYNWNGDNTISTCALHCTPDTATTCNDPASCQGALNGDYGTITMTKDIVAPGGITVTGNHLTFDCNNHVISGTNSGAGILLDNRVGVTIKNCEIRNFGTGLELRSASLNSVERTSLYSNTTGLRLLTTDALVQPNSNTFYNVNAIDNMLYGVQFSGGINNFVSASDLSDNGEYALWVDGPCNNAVNGSLAGNGKQLLYWHDLTGPTSVPTGTYGAVVLCNVANTTVESVTINNGQRENDGILVFTSTQVTIRHNDVTSSRGIALIDTDHSVVFTNTLWGNADAGITLRRSPNNSVLGNTVRMGTQDGIVLADGSNSTTVVSNTVETNNDTGIRVSNTDDVALRGNTVAENHKDGIALEAALGTDLLANGVFANQHGLYLDNQTTQTHVNQNQFCRNEGQDIYNNSGDSSNSGDNNACTFTYYWNDTGESDGCTHPCVGWYNRRWGFSFHNFEVDDLSWTRYRQTFGEDEVNITSKFCLGVPVCIPFKCWCLGKMININTHIPDPYAAILYGLVYENLAEPGMCYGFSGSSLQFYYGDDSPSAYDPSATRVRDLTRNSAHGSYDLEDHLQLIHGSQMSSEALGIYLSQMGGWQAKANTVLARARSGLAAGQPGFVVIKDGLTEGHAMNYDTVVDIDSTTSRIYLYDNNKENFVNKVYRSDSVYPAIIIDRSANDWSYVMAGGSTWGDDYIFDMPYSVVNRNDWTLPGSVNGVLNMITGNAEGNVEDESGHLIGYDTLGDPHEEIPGGMALPVLGAAAGQPWGYLVQPGNYTLNVYQHDGSYTALLLGINGGYILQDIPSTEGAADHLGFHIVNANPAHNELEFTTTGPGHDLNVRMLRTWDAPADRRYYWIHGMTVDAPSHLFFKVTSDYQGTVVANRGTDPIDYEVIFQNEVITGSTSQAPPTRHVETQTIQPGETHTLTPLDWGDLTHSPVVQTQATCGDTKCETGEDHVNCPSDCTEPTCVVPHDDMHIISDTLLCGGVYELPDTGDPGVVVIDSNNVTLDCNGARLVGGLDGVGVRVVDRVGVTIRNCGIEGYAQGIEFINGGESLITASSLMGSQEWALAVHNVADLHLYENLVTHNTNGVLIEGSNGVTVERNYMCDNTDADIFSENNTAANGIQNACTQAGGWHDGEHVPCTYACTTSFNARVFLPLVLRQ